MIWEIDEKKRTIEGLDAEGRPDPAYAAALGLLNAPFGRRALAVACDYAVFLLLQLPLWIGAMPLLAKLMTGSVSTYGFVNHPSFVLAAVMAGVTVLLTLAFSIVQLVLHGRKGVTIGKAISGIRSVNVRTLERPGAGPVLLRFLIIVGSGLVPAIGPALFILSPTFDPSGRGRGWHDKATGVWLVDVRQGLHPYDEKRMRVARKVVKAEPTMERSALPSLATPLDPGAQPEYRPGSRVSAGVLGVARPHESRERPSIGLSQSAPRTEAAPAEAGKPVLGGYRAPDASAAPAVDGTPVQPAPPAWTPPATLPAAAPGPQPTASAPSPQTPAVQTPAPAAAPAPAPTPAAPQPAAAKPSAQQPAARFGLRLDTGESILISGPVLLGRNPDASGHPGARAVPLPDESRSLSKTHLLVRPIAGGLEITDCRSTNGSALVREGVEHTVEAGAAVATIEGDIIRIGDRTADVVRV
ncbi:RDD family protein [Microbacterium sp. bgisy189]|uniref:RDD family protein n=1 Tax=Microbacterium sp. bgisy189 TaxID=3413798 RepID=UPI003EBA7C87